MDEIERLKNEINSINETLQKDKSALKGIDEEENKAYQEYLRIRAAHTAERVRMREAIMEKERKQRELSIEMRRIEAIRQAEEAEKLRVEREKAEKARQDALSKKWDALTAAAPWREWAKDHQISAGHHILANQKVILADEMGLGKTLSSIIACDMAEAVTRFASKQHPVFGEEREVLEEVRVPVKTDNIMPWHITDPDSPEAATVEYTTEVHTIKKVFGGIERPVGRKVLYFCPGGLIGNVKAEFQMWSKHRNVTYISEMTKAERDFAFEHILKDQEEYILICNYEAWVRDWELIENFISINPDTVIIDEAHNIKNLKSSGYRGIKEIIDRANPEFVVPMTGTPILNRPQELFTLLTLVDNQRFYHENDFLIRYCEQDYDNNWTFKSGGIQSLITQIGSRILRRTKDQVGIILPGKKVIVHDLAVDKDNYPNQARARKQMLTHASIIVDEAKEQAISAAAVIAMYTRLRQIETWPAGINLKDEEGNIILQLDIEESQKIDYIIDGNHGLIPNRIKEHRIVVFSQFLAPLRELKKRIESLGYSAVILDGSTPNAERQIINKDFDRRYTENREDAKWDVVLCNYKVGGVGLNFTAATQLIALDEEWNPGKRDQAFDRIHRMGQTEPVTIHVIRNKGTIDDWLAGIMEVKEGIVSGFNNATEALNLKEFLDEMGD